MTAARQSGAIRVGFIPLLDAAPLIVAARGGFGEAEGVRIELVRETSWAALRDRIAVRHLDVAHLLGPMVVADRLGLSPLPSDLIAPLALGAGGNAVVVSGAVWREMDPSRDLAPLDPRVTGRALAAVVAARSARGLPLLSLGIVHPYSVHHYQLAYWLAASGIAPDRDVQLVVVPPPLMPAAIAAGEIDGYCVGEPWGSKAVADAGAHLATTGSRIWASSPEKVLGVRESWASAEPDRLSSVIRAVYRAAVWCDQPGNSAALARLLAVSDLLDVPGSLLATILARRAAGAEPDGAGAGFLAFAEGGVTFPWVSHALWFYAQMLRWGQTAPRAGDLDLVRRAYRPDLYRAALAPVGVPTPPDDERIEGTLDRPAELPTRAGPILLGQNTFFDNATFDPGSPGSYATVATR